MLLSFFLFLQLTDFNFHSIVPVSGFPLLEFSIKQKPHVKERIKQQNDNSEKYKTKHHLYFIIYFQRDFNVQWYFAAPSVKVVRQINVTFTL